MNRGHARRRRTAGLTLVELLVAMAILVTVSAAAAMMFRGVTRAWRTGELRTDRDQQARLLFDLFQRELSSSVANSRFPMLGAEASDTPPLHDGSVSDALFFVGTLPGRTGFIERGYWVNGQSELMCHEEDPADGDYATGESESCGREISEFTVSYFDGTQWLPRWDGRAGADQQGRLPKAIRVTLMIGQPRPERFETIIHVPTS